MTVTPTTEPTTAPTWPDDPYEKALAAEPHLRAVDRMVRAFVALAPTRRSRTPMCAGCIWEQVLKPLAQPWVGWDRGDPADQAPETPRRTWRAISLDEFLDKPDRRPHAETTTETWLRSQEAWDAVTDKWLAMLHAADPANGDGIGRSK